MHRRRESARSLVPPAARNLRRVLERLTKARLVLEVRDTGDDDEEIVARVEDGYFCSGELERRVADDGGTSRDGERGRESGSRTETPVLEGNKVF